MFFREVREIQIRVLLKKYEEKKTYELINNLKPREATEEAEEVEEVEEEEDEVWNHKNHHLKTLLNQALNSLK